MVNITLNKKIFRYCQKKVSKKKFPTINKNMMQGDEFQKKQLSKGPIQKHDSKNKTSFLTIKHLVEQSLRSKLFVKKAIKTCRKQMVLGNQSKKSNDDQTKQKDQNDPEIEQNKLDMNLVEKQEVKQLDFKTQKFFGVWKKFLISVQKIEKKNQNEDKFFPSQQDRNAHIICEGMKEMEYLLNQQDHKMEEVAQKISCIQQDITKYYFQSHQTHEKIAETKRKIKQNNISYTRFLEKLKDQQKQRQKFRQLSQETHQNLISKTKHGSQNFSPQTSPRKYMAELKLSEQQISKIIEKRSKLNLELDLKFQLQLRRKNQQEKSLFQEMKNKLQKQKNNLTTRKKQLEEKIQLKQNQVQRYEQQKERLNEEIKIFLKMLLKNPQYRSDGALWIFRKMIEYGFQPQIFDFSENLDLDARKFLLNQFKHMKDEKHFQLKPEIKKKKKFKKFQRESQNRARVKSLALLKQETDDQINLNSNSPPKQNEEFFSFRSKKFKFQQGNLEIRKKSGSLTVMKKFDSFTFEDKVQSERIENKNVSLTKTLMNVSNRKKIYDSTKKYLKSWVSNQGWNSLTPRVVVQKQKETIPEKFIEEEKSRAKATFFKVGRSNTQYKQVVSTLFGSQKEMNMTARRIKTSR